MNGFVARIEKAGPWAPALVVALLAFVARLPGAFHLPLFVDEPLYLAMVSTPGSVDTLYTATLFNKPIIAAAYYAAANLFPDPYLALWLITQAAICATAVLVYRIGRLLSASTGAAMLGACVFIVQVCHTPHAIASAQLEHPSSLWIALCVFASLQYLREPRARHAATALAAVVLAALTKQYLALFVAIPALCVGTLLFLASGAALILAVFAMHFLLLPGSFYNLVAFSGKYYSPSPRVALIAALQYLLRIGTVIAVCTFRPGFVREILDRRLALRMPRLANTKAILADRNALRLVVLALWGFIALTCTLMTQGWPQHLMIFAPFTGVCAAVAWSRAEQRWPSRTGLLPMGLLVAAYGVKGMMNLGGSDHHADWTYTLVSPNDYAHAVEYTQHANPGTACVFPAPIPEFYQDAHVRPAGFNPENDHRAAFGSSPALQETFRTNFRRNLPTLCIGIAPRPERMAYIDTGYATFVSSVVSQQCQEIHREGGVTIYDCAAPTAGTPTH